MRARRPPTERQLQVAKLVAQGKSAKAIARELRLSVHTVHHHIARLAGRLDGEGPPRNRIVAWYYGAASRRS